MTPLPPHPESTCKAALANIQAMLDGDGCDSHALDRHIADCPDCRSRLRAAEQLLGTLPLFPRVNVPVGLTARIASAVRMDQRNRNRRRLLFRVGVGGALAAAVWIAVFRPFTGDTPEVVVAPKPEKPAPSIRDRLVEARSAVVSLTARAADRTASVLPMPKAVEIPIVAERPSTLEPAAQSLDEAAQGASVAFEPMADAASRAFGFLYRELPTLPERKPDF